MALQQVAPTSLVAVTVYSPASATRALRTSSVCRSPSALMGRVVLLRRGTPSFLQDTAGTGEGHAWAGESELSRDLRRIPGRPSAPLPGLRTHLI